MTTKAPALIDWLVNAFSNAVTLGGPVVNGTQTGPVTVYDGPPTTGLDAPLKLYVGLTDPDSEGIEPAVTITQSRDDLGSATRTEVSEIHCCAEAWSGTDDMRTVRVAVFGITAAVEALVRGDATQFGGNAALAAPGFTAGELLQNNTDKGAIARVPFSLTFRSFT